MRMNCVTCFVINSSSICTPVLFDTSPRLTSSKRAEVTAGAAELNTKSLFSPVTTAPFTLTRTP